MPLVDAVGTEIDNVNDEDREQRAEHDSKEKSHSTHPKTLQS